MGFTDIFGGSTIAPSNATFLSLALVSNITLGWPIEQSISGNVVADTIEVIASAPGFNISISDARQVSSGYTTLFNNVGSNSFNVLDSLGATILSVVSGSAWVVYLADNSTEAGIWRVFQLGAGVSTAVASALAGAGLKAIGNSLNEQITSIGTGATPVSVDSSYRAKLLNWIGGVGIANLVAPATLGSDWFAFIRNSGTGNFTLTPAAGQIDGAATKVLGPGASLLAISDGTNFWTVGFGLSSAGSGAFDFVNIDATGTGTLALAGSNLNRIGYRFTGVLSGDRTIQVPGTIQEYWVSNATTGAFNLYVKTAAQGAPGIAVTQGGSSILASDGNNVFNAVSGTVSIPVAIVQGGSGATTAAGARSNFGSTATGDAVFVAVSQAAAQAAIGLGSVLDTLLRKAQLISGVGGTANAITGTVGGLIALVTGDTYLLVPNSDVSGPTTLNISTIGVKSVLNKKGSPLVGKEMRAGVPYVLFYNGTSFNITNPSASEGTFTASLSGCNAAVTATYNYMKDGRRVCISSGIASILTGTSNSSTCGLSGEPASLYAGNNFYGDCGIIQIYDNNLLRLAKVAVGTAGGFSFILFRSISGFVDAANPFTTSGVKGLGNSTRIEYMAADES